MNKLLTKSIAMCFLVTASMPASAAVDMFLKIGDIMAPKDYERMAGMTVCKLKSMVARKIDKASPMFDIALQGRVLHGKATLGSLGIDKSTPIAIQFLKGEKSRQC